MICFMVEETESLRGSGNPVTTAMQVPPCLTSIAVSTAVCGTAHSTELPEPNSRNCSAR